jgi:hypothetical protein
MVCGTSRFDHWANVATWLANRGVSPDFLIWLTGQCWWLFFRIEVG